MLTYIYAVHHASNDWLSVVEQETRLMILTGLIFSCNNQGQSIRAHSKLKCNHLHLQKLGGQPRSMKAWQYLHFLNTILTLVSFTRLDLFLAMQEVLCCRCTFTWLLAFLTDGRELLKVNQLNQPRKLWQHQRTYERTSSGSSSSSSSGSSSSLSSVSSVSSSLVSSFSGASQ